jgi:hypothetical protein
MAGRAGGDAVTEYDKAWIIILVGVALVTIGVTLPPMPFHLF